jgi:hypothetical protein
MQNVSEICLLLFDYFRIFRRHFYCLKIQFAIFIEVEVDLNQLATS